MKNFRPFFLGLPRDGSSHFSVLWIQSGKHWETQSNSTGSKCSEANLGLWIQEVVHQLKVKMGFDLNFTTEPFNFPTGSKWQSDAWAAWPGPGIYPALCGLSFCSWCHAGV